MVRTKNIAERFFADRLEADGWEVLKRGWPDFLAIRDGRVRLIEVKREGQSLKPQQTRVKEALELLGIEVEVAYFRD